MIVFRWIALIIAAATFAVYGFAVCLKILYPGYVDHIEPTVASVSWLAIHGQPIYSDWSAGDVYGMIYGPLLYLLNGLFLLLSPSIFMSKLPGVLAFIAAVGLFARVLRKKGFDHATVFIFVAVLLAALMPHEFYPYTNRADSFLLLCAVLSLTVLIERPSSPLLGVLAGLASALKLHGAIYILPAVFAGAARGKTPRERLQWLALTGVAALVVMAVFHNNATMISGYGLYLIDAAHHGLARYFLIQNIEMALYLLVPLGALMLWRKPRLNPEDKLFIAGLVVVMIAGIIIGGKPGNGQHHLLPLVPSVVYAIAACLHAPSSRSSRLDANAVAGILLIAALAVFGSEGIGWDRQVWNMYAGAPAERQSWNTYAGVSVERQKISELKKILGRYPGAQIGIGDDAHYADTWYRPLAVYRGAALHLEIPAWMDLVYGGVPEQRIEWMASSCRIPTWIMPGGEAFSMLNPYTAKPLFSDRFRWNFAIHYKLSWRGDFYSVWTCA